MLDYIEINMSNPDLHPSANVRSTVPSGHERATIADASSEKPTVILDPEQLIVSIASIFSSRIALSSDASFAWIIMV